MERWLGSRTARWIIPLGAGLLALLVGLTKYRAGFEEKESPPAAPVKTRPKREALRYGGRNFDQWRVEMETELKPEVRADGMAAMGAFGANGYAAEATRTIVELMAGYDVNRLNAKDKAVVDEATEAVLKIGKPALPVLWEGIRNENERCRRFAIAVWHECLRFSDTDWRPPVAELLKAARHEDNNVRETALELLASLENKPKNCLPILLECLNVTESDVRKKAIDALDEMRPEAREVMPALKKVIADSDPGVRYAALIMAAHYGALAKPVIPAVLKRLAKPQDLCRSIDRGPGPFGNDEFIALMNVLAAIGPSAKEALPRLQKLREEPFAKSEARPEVGEKTTSREIIDKTIQKIEGK